MQQGAKHNLESSDDSRMCLLQNSSLAEDKLIRPYSCTQNKKALALKIDAALDRKLRQSQPGNPTVGCSKQCEMIAQLAPDKTEISPTQALLNSNDVKESIKRSRTVRPAARGGGASLAKITAKQNDVPSGDGSALGHNTSTKMALSTGVCYPWSIKPISQVLGLKANPL
eukprot:1142851-Pelagomonas_calceolata.AAC.7